MKTVASSAITILDTTDHNQLSAYLTSNLSTVQTCTSNGKVYTPDWSKTPLQIQLHVFYNQTEITAGEQKKYQTTWYKQYESGDKSQIGETGTSGTLTININELSESDSGMLTYICTVQLLDQNNKVDPVNVVEAQLTYTLVTESKNVVFAVDAPQGTIFLNQSGTLTLTTNKFYGATPIDAKDATFQWYKYTNTDWQKISGATQDNLIVRGSDVLNIASYKCEMIYKTVTYVGTITLQDKSDTYISEIYTVGGDVFKNGVGGCAVYIIVRANGQEKDPLAGPVSTAYTGLKQDGVYWYEFDNENDKVNKKQYSKSQDAWVEVTDIPQEFTYTWTLLNKNGEDVNFHDGKETKTGKVIYISCNDIDEKGTLQCDVSKKD